MSRKKARKTGYGDGSFRVKPSGLIEYRFIYKDEFGEKSEELIGALNQAQVALEMKDFLDSIYGIEPSDRIFVISKSYLHHEMDRGVKASGVKRIRLHDLRHSHVSLLIDMGFSAVAIGNRVGHESSDITYRYAHMMPSIQDDMAEALDEEWKEGFDVSEES